MSIRANSWADSASSGVLWNASCSSWPAFLPVEFSLPVAGISNPAIQNALLHLGHEFRTDMSLEQVAAQANLTPTYFSELFHKETGTSSGKYLQTLRLRFAASFLLASDLPVTEICFASGFGTWPISARFPREIHGISTSPSVEKKTCNVPA